MHSKSQTVISYLCYETSLDSMNLFYVNSGFANALFNWKCIYEITTIYVSVINEIRKGSVQNMFIVNSIVLAVVDGGW